MLSLIAWASVIVPLVRMTKTNRNGFLILSAAMACLKFETSNNDILKINSLPNMGNDRGEICWGKKERVNGAVSVHCFDLLD